MPTPAMLAEPFECVVPKNWLDDPRRLNHDKVKPVIPTEHLIAFVMPLNCNKALC